MEDIFAKWFETAKGGWLDVIIADRVFGGRHGESPQTPTSYQIVGPVVQIRFKTTERLTITLPEKAVIGPHRELIVTDAADVRFGWHYYGKPQVPEHWCEEIYHRVGDLVQLTRIGPLSPSYEEFEYSGREFVKLL